MAKIRALFVVFLTVWATSCSTVPNNEMRETRFLADGAVSAEIVEKPSNERYEIRAGEQFFNELPTRENAYPVYPAPLLAKRLDPVSIVARLIVSEAGTVEKAEIIESSTPLPEFSESVLLAVRTWTFIPLTRRWQQA